MSVDEFQDIFRISMKHGGWHRVILKGLKALTQYKIVITASHETKCTPFLIDFSHIDRIRS